MGSGSLAAMSIMETKFHDNMEQEEARLLCIEAIEAGIYHDLGSGSNVDVCIIDKFGSHMQRNVKMYILFLFSGQSRQFLKQIPYSFIQGDTRTIFSI